MLSTKPLNLTTWWNAFQSCHLKKRATDNLLRKHHVSLQHICFLVWVVPGQCICFGSSPFQTDFWFLFQQLMWYGRVFVHWLTFCHCFNKTFFLFWGKKGCPVRKTSNFIAKKQQHLSTSRLRNISSSHAVLWCCLVFGSWQHLHEMNCEVSESRLVLLRVGLASPGKWSSSPIVLLLTFASALN